MSYWYSVSAPQDDIVVSTRIRLARNINGIPFPENMTAEQFETVNELVKNAIYKSNLPITKSLKYIKMRDVPYVERFAMVERHIISTDFVSNCQNRAIIISDDESICIMLGEEDHIRIQVLLAGMQPEKAYEIAKLLDDILCTNLDIAFSKQWGFLTECPTNLGTGLRASVMMHLPFIKNNFERAMQDFVAEKGFTVRGIYGEGSKAAASLYQVSNQITLGISETDAIENLRLIAQRLIENEHAICKKLDLLEIEDECMRSFGVLKNARLLTSEEMAEKLSDVKLGMSLGFLECNQSPIKLMIEGRPNMIMHKYGDISPVERDIKRAEMIRNLL